VARALSRGPELPVFSRVGHAGGRIYIDRCTEDWSAIEIDAGGWRLVAEAPVRFLRSVGAEPLPVPVLGGSINTLRKFLNVTDDGFTLAVGWLHGTYNPFGPYAHLALFGQHGRGKTTALRVLRRMIDPNKTDTRTLPPSERDLLVGAKLSWIQSFDNLSRMNDEMRCIAHCATRWNGHSTSARSTLESSPCGVPRARSG
jgi:hypothetical protein